ncbi:neural cell adhesion molecule 2-like isoform X1 [Anticarsia gemmatalis]|uniref:neural cell adhesion molecule 2-like isoform X1 n=1 Tax=Anticarsia gemmatalis TaxID=129554 RepID=UPI003F75C497
MGIGCVGIMLGASRVLWLVIIVLAVGIQGYVETEEFISDLDKPIPTAHAQGVLGKKAALPCDIQPLAAEDHVSMVLWFKETDGEPLYSYDVRGRLASQPKLWSSASGFGTRAYFRSAATPAVLFVDSVVSTDAGVYRCRVDFKNSPTRNLRVNFTVITPPNRPTIMDAKTRSHTRLLEPYNEGDTLELVCECFGGDPRPRLTWYLENTVIDDSYEQRPDGVTVNTLTFPNVGRQHLNTRLVCQASNTNLAAPETKLVILDINLRPLSVQILNKRQQLSADRNYDVECRAVGSRPEALVTWWKGGRQLKRSAKNFSDNNATTSTLNLVPMAEDHEKYLVCRAENPRVPNAVIEDRWLLNVHYVPIVTLKLGSNLNPSYIKEGDDVYFECSVKANPKSKKLTWYKGVKEIQHNASAGVILSDQSLVLQSVSRSAAGDYSCLAYNNEGSATSNPVSLQVNYAPLCKTVNEGEVYGALKMETVVLHCMVDSSPPPTYFSWFFNSSGEQTEISPSLYTNYGNTSTLRYTPSTDMDFGTILCSATNTVGRQEAPCLYKLVAAAGNPTSLQNCSVVNQSYTLLVECLEGFDGGLPQVFYMEVLELPSLMVRANITSNHTPTFEVHDWDSRSSYALVLYAANAKGRSEEVTLYTVAIRPPDKYTGVSTSIPLSPMLVSLLSIAALLCTGVCGVITALYRRHAARRHDIDKHPPSTNALYMEQSVESLSKQDNLNTYCASPKLDYCSQYELKMEGSGEDTDPDIIPCHYDKKPLSDYKLSTPGIDTDPHRMFSDRPIPASASSVSICVVNRGVTARSADIAAARRPEIVTTARKVRESCI